MTVISSTNKGGPWVGDGKTKRYPFSFAVLNKESVRAYVDGEEVHNITVELLDNQEGGAVIFSTAPAAGSGIAVARVEAITQTTDIQNNTAFYPEIIETALDKLTMICQELSEVLGRCITVDITDDMSGKELKDQLLNAQSIAALEANRAELAASKALVDGHSYVQQARHWAEFAESSAVSGDVSYDELGGNAEITPDISFDEDQIIYDEVD